jgi:hypothetical protein
VLVAIPLYIWGFYSEPGTMQLVIWGTGAMFHYAYLGAQYTIGQGVVSQRSRASAIAILLFIIALIGNGLGPQIVGIMSDMFMNMQIQASGMGDTLTTTICRARDLSALTAEQQAVCVGAYGEGVRQSMAATVLFFIPAAAFYLMAAVTLKKDMVAKPV